MDKISALAASGLRARMESLDLLANNIANASTSGYKGDSEFYSLFTSEAAAEDNPESAARFPMIERQWTDFSQGLLEPTNNPLDLALSGKGFFVVKGPSGNLYTRSGNFQFSKDGTIVTSHGYPLLDRGGQPMKADSKRPIEISTDGSVHQNGQQLGIVQLADFNDPAVLAKHGSSYFRNTSKITPADAAGVQIFQGKVEGSNVSATQGAVRLVGLMRQFEMMQKAVAISSDMGRKTIEEVARV